MFNLNPQWENTYPTVWITPANQNPNFVLVLTEIGDEPDTYTLNCLIEAVDTDDTRQLMQRNVGKLIGPIDGVLKAAWDVAWTEFCMLYAAPRAGLLFPIPPS